MLNSTLKKIGLNNQEIKVYLAALELGGTSISRIAKEAGIKRTTAYLVVDGLKDKKLMSSIKKQNKTFYYAEDPRKIKEQMEENLKEIDLAIPELLAIANFIDKKPNIKYFEGKDGIKEVFKDILKYQKSEVLEMYSENYATDFEENFFTNYFTPKRVEKKIWVRAILPNSKIIQNLIKNNQKELRKTKLLDTSEYKIQIEINIYDKNKVSIISFQEELALIIDSIRIHDSLKNIFELLWNRIQ